MIVIPAIDLIGGTCVRLTQGDYATTEKVAEDALETAKSFEAAGAKWLHMVDLDGAKAGKPMNLETIHKVAAGTNLKIELGGGIRTQDNVEEAIDAGVSRVILGSAAIDNPLLVYSSVEKYKDMIAVGIDARNGRVMTGGWLEGTDAHYIELARSMSGAGVQTIIYTDIMKDGMMSGPNLDELKELNDAVGANVTASGGIRDISDIQALAELDLYGAICGKSIYKNTLNLSEAIALTQTIKQ